MNSSKRKLTDEGRGLDISSSTPLITQQLGRDCIRCLYEQLIGVSWVVIRLLRSCCLIGSTAYVFDDLPIHHHAAPTIITVDISWSFAGGSYDNSQCGLHGTKLCRLNRRDPSEAAIGSPLDSAVALDGVHCGRGIAETTLKVDVVGKHVSTCGPCYLAIFGDSGGQRNFDGRFYGEYVEEPKYAEGRRMARLRRISLLDVPVWISDCPH